MRHKLQIEITPLMLLDESLGAYMNLRLDASKPAGIYEGECRWTENGVKKIVRATVVYTQAVEQLASDQPKLEAMKGGG
jgi:hypothetical protein